MAIYCQLARRLSQRYTQQNTIAVISHPDRSITHPERVATGADPLPQYLIGLRVDLSQRRAEAGGPGRAVSVRDVTTLARYSSIDCCNDFQT